MNAILYIQLHICIILNIYNNNQLYDVVLLY